MPDDQQSAHGNCPTPGQLASFYSGELDETRTARMRRHLADCDRCDQSAGAAVDDGEIGELLREARRELSPDRREELGRTVTTIVRKQIPGMRPGGRA